MFATKNEHILRINLPRKQIVEGTNKKIKQFYIIVRKTLKRLNN